MSGLGIKFYERIPSVCTYGVGRERLPICTDTTTANLYTSPQHLRFVLNSVRTLKQTGGQYCPDFTKERNREAHPISEFGRGLYCETSD